VNEPLFLSLDEVRQLHAYQIEQFGGDDAILDLDKLESALAQPRQGFGGQYVHVGLPAMAAAYAFHICQNHPFADGNKRTAAHSAIVFLALNGYEVELPTDEAEHLILGVARGEASKQDLADFFGRLLREQCDYSD
jgi:death-on-curing protein